ncbi:hypothetical protein CEE45_06550 [Candidatus Heimdallarchaeota archaeon B3_Heim]|nr:MAG: hypothetical protein CEE45_06550 [Candidatus Heimdallarchaeota archaeon B3_Heim]
MGILDKLTWKEYFLIGGLMIIWAVVIYAGFTSFTDNDIVTFGFALFLGVIFTGALFILIALIDRIF